MGERRRGEEETEEKGGEGETEEKGGEERKRQARSRRI